MLDRRASVHAYPTVTDFTRFTSIIMTLTETKTHVKRKMKKTISFKKMYTLAQSKPRNSNPYDIYDISLFYTRRFDITTLHTLLEKMNWSIYNA